MNILKTKTILIICIFISLISNAFCELLGQGTYLVSCAEVRDKESLRVSRGFILTKNTDDDFKLVIPPIKGEQETKVKSIKIINDISKNQTVLVVEWSAIEIDIKNGNYNLNYLWTIVIDDKEGEIAEIAHRTSFGGAGISTYIITISKLNEGDAQKTK